MSSIHRPATIYHHPRSYHVVFSVPPVTRESIRQAIQQANKERQDVTRQTGVVIPLHPDPEFHPVSEGEGCLVAAEGSER